MPRRGRSRKTRESQVRNEAFDIVGRYFANRLTNVGVDTGVDSWDVARNLARFAVASKAFWNASMHRTPSGAMSVYGLGSYGERSRIATTELRQEMVRALPAFDTVKNLLQRGANPGAKTDDGTPFIVMATRVSNLAMVELFINAGAVLDAQDGDANTSLVHAVRFNIEIANMLVDAGADVNIPNNMKVTPLMCAACGGHLDISTHLVEKLIDKGAKINDQDDNGTTALMYACSNGQLDIACMLIDKGAKINDQDDNGITALMCACSNGQLDIACMLIDKGARTEMENNKGNSALLYAVYNGHHAIANMLIDKGAKINDQDDNGTTVLMYAVDSGDDALVQKLIGKGANVFAVDHSQRTALDRVDAATNIDREAMACLLREAMRRGPVVTIRVSIGRGAVDVQFQ